MIAIAASAPAAWGQAQPPGPAQPFTPIPSPEILAQVEIDPGLEALVAQLDDPSYQTRQEAMVALRDGPCENLGLFAILERLSLSAEQRHRVLTVLAERLLGRPRGAVGVQAADQHQVVVMNLVPGLPAQEVLQVGDRITHLDGRPVASWGAFRFEVQSRLPGTKVTLTVERAVRGPGQDGGDAGAAQQPEVLRVEIVLGSAEDLRDPTTGLLSPGARGQELEDTFNKAMERFGARPQVLDVQGEAPAAEEKEPLLDLQPDLPSGSRRR